MSNMKFIYLFIFFFNLLIGFGQDFLQNGISEYIPRTEIIGDTVFSKPVVEKNYNPSRPNKYLLKEINNQGYYVYQQIGFYKYKFIIIMYNNSGTYNHFIEKIYDPGVAGRGKVNRINCFTYYSNGNIKDYCSLGKKNGFYIQYDSLENRTIFYSELTHKKKYYCFKIASNWYTIEESYKSDVKKMSNRKRKKLIKNQSDIILLSDIFDVLGSSIW